MNSCTTNQLIKGFGIALAALLISAFFGYLILDGVYSSDAFLPKVQVISLNVSSFNVSNSHITSNWNISFNMENNHLWRTYTFYSVEVSVFYKNKNNLASHSWIDGFSIQPGHHQLLNATAFASLLNIDNSVGGAADAIVADKASGAVDFNLVLHCEWCYAVRSNAVKLLKTDVLCNDIQVGFSNRTGNSTGAMLGGPRSCINSVLSNTDY